MRRLLAAIATIATTAAVGVALSSGAAAAPPADGTYTAITPYRAADTALGVHDNRKGALPATAASLVSLTGFVPGTARAVVVSLTATGSTTSGALMTYADGSAVPATWTLRYRPRVTSTVTAIVPVSNARFLVRNSGVGSTGFTVDVLGYYGSFGTAGVSGALTSVPARRVLGATAVLGAGASRVVDTGFVGTVGLQVHVLDSTTNGSLAIYRTEGSAPATGSNFYGVGTGYSGFVFGRTDSEGQVTVVNRGSAAVHLALDVTATFPGESTTLAGGLQTVAPQRLVTGQSLGAGAVASVAVTGKRGVARARVGAAAVAVTVGGPATSGQVTVGAPGKTSAATRTVSFGTGQTLGNTVVVPVTNGKFEVRNGSKGAVKLYVDVLGYLPSDSLTPPAANLSAARYLSNLTEAGAANGDNRDALGEEGCTDVGSGASFALIDVGAQSYHEPLSKTTPGVALANTDPKDPERLTYAQLVDAVKGYIDGVADSECNGSRRAVGVAVGTNNSGNFADTSTPKTNPVYPATQRGKDWFTGVIKPLQQYAASKTGVAINVAAAVDIENDAVEFDDVYQNAKSWEDSYLTASKGSQNDKLIFNGAAIDCPAYFGDTVSTCNAGWTLGEFVALTTNQNRVQTVPQIYTATTAAQWTNIASYANVRYKRTVAFLGALTQHALAPGDYTADQGWTALVRGLSSIIVTPSVPRSVAFVS